MPHFFLRYRHFVISLLILGLATIIYFSFKKYIDIPRVRTDIQAFLDLDFLHLKNGLRLKGYLQRQDSEEISFETDQGSMTIPLKQVDTLQENLWAQYLKTLW